MKTNILRTQLPLTLLMLTAPVLAEDGGATTCPSDAYEPNDSPETAYALTVPNSLTDLGGCGDQDWYRFTVPANNGLTIEMLFVDEQADLDMYVYLAEDNEDHIYSSAGTSDREWLDAAVFPSETELLLKVRNYSARSNAAAWTPYQLAIVLYDGGYDRCSEDDSREDNDSASNASALSVPGVVSDLVGCDDDWYSFTVPANHGVAVQMTHRHDDANLNLFMYQAGATWTAMHSAVSSSDNEHLHHLLFDEQTDVLIRVKNNDLSDGVTAAYTLEVTLHQGGYDPCENDDAHEPNNGVESASALTVPGATDNLLGCNTDWYSFTVPAMHGVHVRMNHQQADANLNLFMYQASDTQNALHSSISTTNDEQLFHLLFEQQTDVYLKVSNADQSRGATATYTLDVTLHQGGFDPCAPDDAFEQNDSPDVASALTVPGKVDDLIGCDDDWYSFTVPANTGVVVDMVHQHADANLNLFMYRADDPETPLHHSTSGTDNERLFQELFASQTQVLLKVVKQSYAEYSRAPYTLEVALHEGGFDPCHWEEDDHEPNNSSHQATGITVPGEYRDLTACSQDWYRFYIPAGEGVSVQINFLDSDSDLDLLIYTEPETDTELDTAIDTSFGSDDSEEVCISPVTTDTRLLLWVKNFGYPDSATYDLSLELHQRSCAGVVPFDAGVGPDGRSGADSSGGADGGGSDSDAAGVDGGRNPDASGVDTSSNIPDAGGITDRSNDPGDALVDAGPVGDINKSNNCGCVGNTGSNHTSSHLALLGVCMLLWRRRQTG